MNKIWYNMTTMDTEDIEKKLMELICDQLGVNEDEVQPNSEFQTDLGADELDFVELIMAMEEEFEIAITDEEADRATTPSKALELVKSKLEQKG